MANHVVLSGHFPNGRTDDHLRDLAVVEAGLSLLDDLFFDSDEFLGAWAEEALECGDTGFQTRNLAGLHGLFEFVDRVAIRDAIESEAEGRVGEDLVEVVDSGELQQIISVRSRNQRQAKLKRRVKKERVKRLGVVRDVRADAPDAALRAKP